MDSYFCQFSVNYWKLSAFQS